MAMLRPFAQIDVFSSLAYGGNPVAVVLDAQDLDTGDMQRFARWTNLSETTFVLPPTRHDASYRVRIFTPSTELPFAGHPTLGTCHAWLAYTSTTADAAESIVQECEAGLVELRWIDDRLAFGAPPVIRSGSVSDPVLTHLADQLGIRPDLIVDAQWVDNGPGWVAVLLQSAEAVLALRPGPVDLDIGAVGLTGPGSEEAVEIRAFVPSAGGTVEDPVTGSLNASVAEWLLGTGRLTAPYVARQGTVLGRSGRVHVSQDDRGRVWVGGDTTTRIVGEVEL